MLRHSRINHLAPAGIRLFQGKGGKREQSGNHAFIRHGTDAGIGSMQQVVGGDGGEFGATTGRPRRMGWFDCVASRYGCRMQGTTDVAFTVLDVLGYLDEIPVCVAYEVDGKEIHDFPNTSILEKANGSENPSGMEMRYPRHQEIRGSAGELQKLHRVCRERNRIPDHHDLQRTGKRRYHLPQ